MREIRSIRRERGKGHSRVCSLLFLPLSAPPPPLLYTPRSSLLSPSPPSLAPFVCTSNSLRSRGARDAKRHEVRTRAVSFGFRRPHATRPIESQKTRPLSSPLSSLSLRPSTSIQMARRLKKAQLFLATLVVSGAALLAASSAPHRASATFVAPTTPPTSSSSPSPQQLLSASSNLLDSVANATTHKLELLVASLGKLSPPWLTQIANEAGKRQHEAKAALGLPTTRATAAAATTSPAALPYAAPPTDAWLAADPCHAVPSPCAATKPFELSEVRPARASAGEGGGRLSAPAHLAPLTPTAPWSQVSGPGGESSSFSFSFSPPRSLRRFSFETRGGRRGESSGGERSRTRGRTRNSLPPLPFRPLLLPTSSDLFFFRLLPSSFDVFLPPSHTHTQKRSLSPSRLRPQPLLGHGTGRHLRAWTLPGVRGRPRCLDGPRGGGGGRAGTRHRQRRRVGGGRGGARQGARRGRGGGRLGGEHLGLGAGARFPFCAPPPDGYEAAAAENAAAENAAAAAAREEEAPRLPPAAALGRLRSPAARVVVRGPLRLLPKGQQRQQQRGRALLGDPARRRHRGSGLPLPGLVRGELGPGPGPLPRRRDPAERWRETAARRGLVVAAGRQAQLRRALRQGEPQARGGLHARGDCRRRFRGGGGGRQGRRRRQLCRARLRPRRGLPRRHVGPAALARLFVHHGAGAGRSEGGRRLFSSPSLFIEGRAEAPRGRGRRSQSRSASGSARRRRPRRPGRRRVRGAAVRARQRRPRLRAARPGRGLGLLLPLDKGALVVSLGGRVRRGRLPTGPRRGRRPRLASRRPPRPLDVGPRRGGRRRRGLGLRDPQGPLPGGRGQEIHARRRGTHACGRRGVRGGGVRSRGDQGLCRADADADADAGGGAAAALVVSSAPLPFLPSSPHRGSLCPGPFFSSLLVGRPTSPPGSGIHRPAASPPGQVRGIRDPGENKVPLLFVFDLDLETRRGKRLKFFSPPPPKKKNSTTGDR